MGDVTRSSAPTRHVTSWAAGGHHGAWPAPDVVSCRPQLGSTLDFGSPPMPQPQSLGHLRQVCTAAQRWPSPQEMLGRRRRCGQDALLRTGSPRPFAADVTARGTPQLGGPHVEPGSPGPARRGRPALPPSTGRQVYGHLVLAKSMGLKK